MSIFSFPSIRARFVDVSHHQSSRQKWTSAISGSNRVCQDFHTHTVLPGTLPKMEKPRNVRTAVHKLRGSTLSLALFLPVPFITLPNLVVQVLIGNLAA